MPTPEQQTQYVRLYDLLQRLCLEYLQELPLGTRMVLLTNVEKKIWIAAYDNSGELIGIIPNDGTSTSFMTALTYCFADVVSPDNAIMAIL